MGEVVDRDSFPISVEGGLSVELEGVRGDVDEDSGLDFEKN